MSADRPVRRLPRPRVWWWIAAALVLHVLAWTVWFRIAARHPVADVPLATSSRR
jgi:hypothetical protein